MVGSFEAQGSGGGGRHKCMKEGGGKRGRGNTLVGFFQKSKFR